jgi:hypothetical protein
LGAGDTFTTPFDRIVLGVKFSATGISNLLAGDGLVTLDGDEVHISAMATVASLFLPACIARTSAIPVRSNVATM